MKYDPKDHFTLRYHPRNQGAANAALRHERDNPEHYIMDLMDDLPKGDICAGLCCATCDWDREFVFKAKRLRKLMS